VFDALLDFDPMTLDPKPGLARTFGFEDRQPCHGACAECELPRRHAVRCGRGQVPTSTAPRTDPRSNVKADIATVRAVEVGGKYRVILRLGRPNAALAGGPH